MSKEIELKLRLRQTDVATLTQYLNQQAQSVGHSTLNNTYFDTEQAALSQTHAALRIRQTEQGFEQTLKTRGEGKAGLHERGEWNWSLPAEQLNIELLTQGDVAEHWPAHIELNALHAIFRTDFERSTWLWQQDVARIEVVIDVGHIQAGANKQPLCEVELELKQGEAQDLWRLALQLGEQVPLWISDISKAERGYRLAQLSRGWTQAPSVNAQDDVAVSLPVWLNYEAQQFKRALEAGLWEQDTHAILRARRHWQALRQLPQRAGKAIKRRDTKVLREALDQFEQPLQQAAVTAQLLHYLRSADDVALINQEQKMLTKQLQQIVEALLADTALAQALTQACHALYELPAFTITGETTQHWLRSALQQ